MKSIYIVFFSICLFGMDLNGQTESVQAKPFERQSISISIGKLKEWRAQEVSSCAPNNQGISNSLAFRGFLTSKWFVRADLHLDLVNDPVLSDLYFSGSYQLSLGRELYSSNRNSFFIGLGAALTQERLVTYQCLNLGDGPRPENISEVSRVSSFFSKVNLEYEHHLTDNWSVGLSLTNYYDLVGFGRTDFTGIIRFHLNN